MSAPLAVITGAASGIGLALAGAAAKRGYQLALSDYDSSGEASIRAALPELSFFYTPCDVSDADAVADFADTVWQAFGRVDLLFNNAGIMTPGQPWQMSPAQFKQIIDVNLNGVYHGIHAFMPKLMGQDLRARIVNTASLAGLVPTPMFAAYNAAKHGVIALSETLHYDAQMADLPVDVSVLAPGAVATNIMLAKHSKDLDDATKGLLAYLHEQTGKVGLTPDVVAEIAFTGIEAGRYWIFPHDDQLDRLRRRADMIIAGTTPEFEPW